MRRSSIVFIVLVAFGIAGCSSDSVQEISHGHGLAVDSADPGIVYIATHEGLLVMENDQNLKQIGDARDDYMGFSVHPGLPGVFFTSGHASIGGNLGFQKSEDGGKTWRKISDGVGGPVDFHAMAISPANPDLVYGWYAGSLQRSEDGGVSWEVVNVNMNIISLSAHPLEEGVVFAMTPEGILISKDKGGNFENFSEELRDTPVIFLGIDPKNPKNMFSMSQKLGFALSNDAGTTWKRIAEDFAGDLPFYIAIDPHTSDTLYVLTKGSALYKSTDGGISWGKVR